MTVGEQGALRVLGENCDGTNGQHERVGMRAQMARQARVAVVRADDTVAPMAPFRR